VFAHSGKHGKTLAGNNVSATMFPSLPRALFIYLFVQEVKQHILKEMTSFAKKADLKSFEQVRVVFFQGFEHLHSIELVVEGFVNGNSECEFLYIY
jgi:hypothetical protein